MTLQDELRRLAGQMQSRESCDKSRTKAILQQSADRIDELEREVERLKNEKEDRC